MECFERMLGARKFRNVVARVLTANEAYGNVTVCEGYRDEQQRQRIQQEQEEQQKEGEEEDAEECDEYLSDALAAVCSFDHITLW